MTVDMIAKEYFECFTKSRSGHQIFISSRINNKVIFLQLGTRTQWEQQHALYRC